MTAKLFNPEKYWDRRYRDGRTSGEGSEGETARLKGVHVTDVINRFDVQSVIDWGVGDGVVLAHIDTSRLAGYGGIDVSHSIIDRVSKTHEGPNRVFMYADKVRADLTRCDMALSMDVLFHFPDEVDYRHYLDQLFTSAVRYVLVYSTDYGPNQTARHVLRRNFTADLDKLFPDWKLIEGHGNNPQVADFYLYQKVGSIG